MHRSKRLFSLIPALGLALGLAFAAGPAFAVGPASPPRPDSAAGSAAADEAVKAAFLVDAESYLGAALMTAQQMRSGQGLQAEETEIVVVGPAVKALVAGGKLAPMIAKAHEAGIRVVACKFAMDKLGVKPDSLAPGVDMVDNGFTRILERERDGWLTLEM